MNSKNSDNEGLSIPVHGWIDGRQIVINHNIRIILLAEHITVEMSASMKTKCPFG